MKRLSLMSIGLSSALMFATVGCDVDVEEEGSLPDVDVSAEPGNMPEMDVEGPEVDANMETKEVEVPDLDVDTETKEVQVPDLDIDTPEENDN